MKGKGKHRDHEEHMDESWLIPYADLLTLLLALFIVLFASSTVDKEKYNAVMEAMHEAFGPPPAFQSQVLDPAAMPYPQITEPDQETGDSSLDSLYSAISDYVVANDLQETVSIRKEGQNVLLTLTNDIWFDSGSKEVSDVMLEKVTVIAQILRENHKAERPFEIVVGGHTDNVPTYIEGYTNWQLSVDRAVEFLRLLIQDSGMDPACFSARGYGESHPIASNATAQGRQKNRRVEVLISQTTPVEALQNLPYTPLRPGAPTAAIE